MVVFYQPKIDNIDLSIVRNVSNADIDVTWDVNWNDFDQNTDIVYTEVMPLVEVDPDRNQTIYIAPVLASGISSNGSASTSRSHSVTLDWDELNLDPTGDDEIAVVIEMTPRLPDVVTTQSASVVVQSP